MPHSRPPFALVNLTRAFLAGSWSKRELRERGERACPGNASWMRGAVNRLVRQFGSGIPPSFDALLETLMTDSNLTALRPRHSIGELFWPPAAMQPRCDAAIEWNLPVIATEHQLAQWLNISLVKLDWLARKHDWPDTSPSEKLNHYVYRWQPRRRGRFRLIESPKSTLKAIQRKMLSDILDRIPAHPAAHGFRSKRSVLTFAAPHVGKRIVLRFDLRDFFPSVRYSRIQSVFRTAGYPASVARLLGGLCTTRIPDEVWQNRPNSRDCERSLGELLFGRHLPQGAPTSPALANLCAYRLDSRLERLAESAQAVYTRYADDLAFSGDERLEQSARRFQIAVAAICYDEGFEMHFQKSRFMRQGVCQQLGGVVVNDHPNIRRAVYDELKAVLTNCARHGPGTQNRNGHADFRGHLLGKITYVQMVSPARGAKLRKLFEQIRW